MKKILNEKRSNKYKDQENYKPRVWYKCEIQHSNVIGHIQFQYIFGILGDDLTFIINYGDILIRILIFSIRNSDTHSPSGFTAELQYGLVGYRPFIVSALHRPTGHFQFSGSYLVYLFIQLGCVSSPRYLSYSVLSVFLYFAFTHLSPSLSGSCFPCIPSFHIKTLFSQ